MPPRALVLAAAVAALAPPLAASADQGRQGPYTIELLDEAGRLLPAFEHRGRTYVLGTLGQRYLVRVRNDSGRRVEVVVSVDGRDVVDGEPAGWDKRGYLVEPHGEVAIDGYRLSTETVAAFRFSSVAHSYAARLGDARDVGVIGAAIFPERAPRPPRPCASSRERMAPEGAAKAGPGAASEDAAPAPPAAALGRAERPGLGTEFAEQHDSRVEQVAFERARARPDALLTVRYDDRDGLLGLGVDVDGRGRQARDDAWLRERANPFRQDGFAAPPPGWHSR